MCKRGEELHSPCAPAVVVLLRIAQHSLLLCLRALLFTGRSVSTRVHKMTMGCGYHQYKGYFIICDSQGVWRIRAPHYDNMVTCSSLEAAKIHIDQDLALRGIAEFSDEVRRRHKKQARMWATLGCIFFPVTICLMILYVIGGQSRQCSRLST